MFHLNGAYSEESADGQLRVWGGETLVDASGPGLDDADADGERAGSAVEFVPQFRREARMLDPHAAWLVLMGGHLVLDDGQPAARGTLSARLSRRPAVPRIVPMVAVTFYIAAVVTGIVAGVVVGECLRGAIGGGRWSRQWPLALLRRRRSSCVRFGGVVRSGVGRGWAGWPHGVRASATRRAARGVSSVDGVGRHHLGPGRTWRSTSVGLVVRWVSPRLALASPSRRSRCSSWIRLDVEVREGNTGGRCRRRGPRRWCGRDGRR